MSTSRPVWNTSIWSMGWQEVSAQIRWSLDDVSGIRRKNMHLFMPGEIFNFMNCNLESLSISFLIRAAVLPALYWSLMASRFQSALQRRRADKVLAQLVERLAAAEPNVAPWSQWRIKSNCARATITAGCQKLNEWLARPCSSGKSRGIYRKVLRGNISQSSENC